MDLVGKVGSKRRHVCILTAAVAFGLLPQLAYSSNKLGGSDVIELPVAGESLTAPTGTALSITQDAAAVSLNATVVNPAGSGYVTVYPCSTERPLASNLNFTKADVVPNGVIAPVGIDGKVCFYGSTDTDFVVDVAGWFSGDAFVGVTPRRLVDTRKGTGSDATQITPSDVLRVPVRAVDVVTPAGLATTVPEKATAASLNVTVVNPVGGGYVTAYPCDVERPLSSNVNFAKDQVVANGVVAPLSSAGEVCIYASTSTDIVVDLAGWFANDRFIGATPNRRVDTRDGTGGTTGKITNTDELAIPVHGITLSVSGTNYVVPGSATAAALNVTAVDPDGGGYITVYPCGVDRPLASNLNYVKGDIVANNVIAPIGVDGNVCIYSSTSSHVVVDIAGWFEGDETNGFFPGTPKRLVDTRNGTGPSPGLATSEPPPPVTGLATLESAEGEAIVVDLPSGGLAGTDLTFEILQAPLYGELTGTGDQRLYVADDDFVGTDSFLVLVKGSGGQAVTQQVDIVLSRAQLNLEVSKFGEGTIAPQDGGPIDCNESICRLTRDKGTEVMLAATADPDWEFERWSGCDSVTAAGECRIVLDQDEVVYPTFLSTEPVETYDALIELTQSDLDSLVDYDIESSSLYFVDSYDVSHLTAGQILLANGSYNNQPIYFARRITHIADAANGKREIETEYAAIDEIIKSGTVSATQRLRASDVDPASLSPAFSMDQSRALVDPYVIPLNVSTTIRDIPISGSLNLTLTPDLALRVGPIAGLKEFRAIVEAEIDQSLSIVAGSSVELFKEKVPLGSPIYFAAIPAGPLIFIPKVQIYVEFGAELGGGIGVTLSVSQELKAGIHYLKGVGWQNVGDYEIDAGLDLDASVGLAVELGTPVEQSLLLYGVTGPKIGLVPYVRGVGSVSVPFDEGCKLDVNAFTGLKATAGGEVSLLSKLLFEYNATLLDVNTPIYSRKCSGSADQEAPTAPSLTSVSRPSALAAELAWDSSTDNRAVSSYQIYRNFELIDETQSTGFIDRGLSSMTEYCYYISAMDEAGNTSMYSNTECVMTGSNAASQSPTMPENVMVQSTTANAISLEWSPATDDGSVELYSVMAERSDGSLFAVANTEITSATITGLQPTTEYCYVVVTVDDQGNQSDPSAQVCATTRVDDAIVVLADGLVNPSSFVIHKGKAYVLGVSGSLLEIDMDSGTQRMLTEGGRSTSGFRRNDIVVRDDTLYWSVNLGSGTGYISTVSLPGEEIRTLTSANQPGSIVVDENFLYWAEYNGGTTSFTGIRKIPINTEVNSEVRTLTTEGNNYAALVADDTNLYYGYLNDGGCRIASISKSGGEPNDLVVVDCPSAMSLSQETLYWVGPTRDGALYRMSITDGNPSVLAGEIDSPGDIATDGETIHWIDRARYTEDPAAIRSVSKSGGSVTTHVTGRSHPRRLVLHNGDLYFIESGSDVADGKLLMLDLTSGSPSLKDCDICPEMVVIPAGTFQMGDRAGVGNSNELPVHTVTVSSFAIGKYEVTFDQYDAFTQATGRALLSDPEGWGRGMRPASRVPWSEANDYVEWLSQETGKSYRLPSEAEWEYAARADSTTIYHFGNDEAKLCDFGNVEDQSLHPGWPDATPCDDGEPYTAEVGTYLPNAFGLYDVHGNVWEWTRDCWNNDYTNAPDDGSAWLSGYCGGVSRGGAWTSEPLWVRSAVRVNGSPSMATSNVGFRIARDL